MFDGMRDGLLNALREYAATLGADRFVYRQIIEAAIAVQVGRAQQYLLPRGGHVDRLECRDQTPGSNRIFRLPQSEMFLEWETDATEWGGALCFRVDGASNVASVLPSYWRTFFPREFAPRLDTVAIVPFRLANQQFVMPEVAMVFGTDEYFWRDVTSSQPLRTSLVVRDPLCVANPRIVFLTREAHAQFEGRGAACMANLSACAYCAGVLEALCGTINPVTTRLTLGKR